MEEQVQKRAGGDWNHGEPKSGASGECASSPRSWTLLGKKPEEWGQLSLYILYSVRKQCTLEIPLNAVVNSRSLQWKYKFTITSISSFLSVRFALQQWMHNNTLKQKGEIFLSGNALCLLKDGKNRRGGGRTEWLNLHEFNFKLYAFWYFFLHDQSGVAARFWIFFCSLERLFTGVKINLFPVTVAVLILERCSEHWIYTCLLTA